MNTRRFIPVVVSILAFAGIPTQAEERNPELEKRLVEMIDNWRTTSAETLRLPQNADVVQELRLMARGRNPITAVPALLIRMGDEETIKSTVNLLQTARPNRRNIPVGALAAAANPDVIPLLIDSLMIEEGPEDTFDGECQFVSPLSMIAASIIRRTIAESPVFSQEVKEWQHPLSKFDGTGRDAIRRWWVLNQDALVRKDYKAVVPLPPGKEEAAHPESPSPR